MYMYCVVYSFDVDKPTFGPFESEVEAWKAMCEDAENEAAAYRQDHDGAEPEIIYDEDAGEVVMTTPNLVAGIDNDTQKWILLEMPKSKEKTDNQKGIYRLSMNFVADKAAREKFKQFEHHIEYLLDLECWPEIVEVFDVRVEEDM